MPLSVRTASHVRRRLLNADFGRWLTREPSGYVDGFNLYEYVASKPEVHVDPSGALLCGIPCHPDFTPGGGAGGGGGGWECVGAGCGGGGGGGPGGGFGCYIKPLAQGGGNVNNPVPSGTACGEVECRWRFRLFATNSPSQPLNAPPCDGRFIQKVTVQAGCDIPCTPGAPVFGAPQEYWEELPEDTALPNLLTLIDKCHFDGCSGGNCEGKVKSDREVRFYCESTWAGAIDNDNPDTWIDVDFPLSDPTCGDWTSGGFDGTLIKPTWWGDEKPDIGACFPAWTGCSSNWECCPTNNTNRDCYQFKYGDMGPPPPW